VTLTDDLSNPTTPGATGSETPSPGTT
jgi:hypothetical protein